MDVIAIGNGVRDQSSPDNASTLQYTSLRTISNFRCWLSYPSFVFYRKTGFCAKGEENRSVRAGDLGTPLISANDRTLVGVTSIPAPLGCTHDCPQFFTRISTYFKWIEQITGISSCQKDF